MPPKDRQPDGKPPDPFELGDRLGQIASRLDNQNGQIKAMATAVKKNTSVLSSVASRLHALEGKIAEHEDEAKWQSRNRLTFRQKLYIFGLGAGLSLAAWCLGAWHPWQAIP